MSLPPQQQKKVDRRRKSHDVPRLPPSSNKPKKARLNQYITDDKSLNSDLISEPTESTKPMKKKLTQKYHKYFSSRTSVASSATNSACR